MALGTWTVNTGTSNFTVTIPSGTDRIATLFVDTDQGTPISSISATVGGVTMLSAGTPSTSNGGGSEVTTYAFYLLDSSLPAAGSQTLSTTITGGTNVYYVRAFAVHDGRAQQVPLFYTTASNSTTSFNLGPLTTVNDAYGLASVSNTGVRTHTVGGSWAERWDTSNSAGDMSGTGADITYSSAGTDTVNFVPSAASKLAGIFLVLNPSSAQRRGYTSMQRASVFIDNFNRANGNIGNNYDTMITGSGLSLVVLDNFIIGPSVDGHSISAIKPSVANFSSNHESQITYAQVNSFDFAGPAVRADYINGNCYYLRIDGSDHITRRIAKLTAGVESIIGTVNIPAVSGDVLKLQASGSSISAYKNGVLVNTVTDASFSTGQPALYYKKENSNGTKLDNFIAADLSTGGRIAIVSPTGTRGQVIGTQ